MEVPITPQTILIKKRMFFNICLIDVMLYRLEDAYRIEKRAMGIFNTAEFEIRKITIHVLSKTRADHDNFIMNGNFFLKSRWIKGKSEFHRITIQPYVV